MAHGGPSIGPAEKATEFLPSPPAFCQAMGPFALTPGRNGRVGRMLRWAGAYPPGHGSIRKSRDHRNVGSSADKDKVENYLSMGMQTRPDQKAMVLGCPRAGRDSLGAKTQPGKIYLALPAVPGVKQYKPDQAIF